jgi:hypothetical protein
MNKFLKEISTQKIHKFQESESPLYPELFESASAEEILEFELKEAKEIKKHKIEEIYLQENLKPHFFDGLVLSGLGTGTIKKYRFSLDFQNQKIPALEPDRYLKISCITQRPLPYATVDEKNNKIVVRIKPNEALTILNHVINRFQTNFAIYSIIQTQIENCKKIEDLDKIVWDPKLATPEMLTQISKLMNS